MNNDDHTENDLASQLAGSSIPNGRIGRPALDESERMALKKIADQAREMRSSFGRSRGDYNAAICDMLAAAGIAPSGRLALQVGRWGTTSDVQADVRAWYAALSKDKADRDLRIPPAARRRGLDLLEQLFELANQAAQIRLEERLIPLRQAEEHARDQATQLTVRARTLEEQLQAASLKAQEDAVKALERQSELENAVAAGQVQALELQRQLNQAGEQLQAQSKQALREKEQAQVREHELERQIAAGREALAQAQAKAAQQLLEAQRAADADRQALMLRSDKERHAQANLIESLSHELTQSRQRIDALVGQVSSLTLDATNLRTEMAAAHQELKRVKSGEYQAAQLTQLIEIFNEAGYALSLDLRGDDEGTARQAREVLFEWIGGPSPSIARILSMVTSK